MRMGGSSKGQWVLGGDLSDHPRDSSGTQLCLLRQPGQDEGARGQRVRFQSLSPIWGRRGASQASPAAVQIPAGDTWPWSTARADRSGSGGEQVPPPLPSLPRISAHPASLPKTEPSCFHKGLEPGLFPNLFYCRAFREVREEGAPTPELHGGSLVPELWHLRLSLLLQ